MHLRRRGLLVFLLLAAAVPALPKAAAAQEPAPFSERALKRLKDPYLTSPSTCHDGWNAGTDGIVVAVEPWAENAGLLPGDRIVGLNGHEISDSYNWIMAMRHLPAERQFDLAVRRGDRPISLTLPCQEHRSWVAEEKRVWTAIVSEDWQGCIDHALALIRLFGRPTSQPLDLMLRCWARKVGGDTKARDQGTSWYMSTLHRYATQLLLESRYRAGGVAAGRTRVVGAIQVLAENGYSEFAEDLRTQLAAATNAAKDGRPPTERPSSGEAWERSGTAFLIRSDGTLVTALHVVDAADEVAASCPGHDPFRVTIATSSNRNDVAVLRPAGPQQFDHHLAFGAAKVVAVGDHVFTVGYPVRGLLGDEAKYSEGTISALSGLEGDASFLQVSVPIQPGNSGGPLLNERGEVVGVILSTASAPLFARLTGSLPQNINWALKASFVLALLGDGARPAGVVPAGRKAVIEQALRNTCLVVAKGSQR